MTEEVQTPEGKKPLRVESWGAGARCTLAFYLQTGSGLSEDGPALTCRTSCLSPGGSTQLTRRSSRSTRAEVPICRSTRPTNLPFFFKNTITWNQAHPDK